MKAKKFFCLLLGTALIFSMQPAAAFAAGDADSLAFDVSEGSVAINAAGRGYLTVTYGPEQTTTAAFPETQTITITGSTASNTVTVGPGASADVTLYNVSLDVSAEKICAFSMAGADVSLTLEGTNTVASGGIYAGLFVPDGAELTIDGVGSLSAAGGGDPSSGGGAGIGGNSGSDGGTVIINSGTVTASAPYGGAGIGGGSFGSGGTIEINGGTVTAKNISAAGVGGAGIGGGYSGSGGMAIINGGSVKAYAGVAAGIGGGSLGNGGMVEINGGTVTATGKYGAGIGGGDNGGIGGTVIIDGGSVAAVSSKAQAIGAGQGGSYNGTLKNGNGMDVFLTRLTFAGAANTPIPADNLLFDGTAAGYGKTDLKTDADGTLYFYLPEGPALAVYGGALYIENVANNHFNELAPTGQSAYTVDYDLTGISPDGLSIFVIGGQAFDVTLIPDDGFILPGSITVEMSGTELTQDADYTYDSETGAVTIDSVSGDILITASAEEMTYDPGDDPGTEPGDDPGDPGEDPDDGAQGYFSITAAQSSGGTILLSKAQVAEGGKVIVTVKADKGFKIADVLVNGTSVGAVKKYKIENITEDITISAVFEPNKKGSVWGNPCGGHDKDKHPGKDRDPWDRHPGKDKNPGKNINPGKDKQGHGQQGWNSRK